MTSRYPARDLEMAEGSGPVSMEFLKDFYAEAYQRIRKHTDKLIVFHDGFELKECREYLYQKKFENIMLDTHQYLMMAELLGCEQTIEGYEHYIHEQYANLMEETQRYVPVICGEWCLFNSMACGFDTKGGQTELNGIVAENKKVISEDKKCSIYRRIAKAQIEAWEKGSGYFYWNYKLLLDTVNYPNWKGWEPWDMGRSAAMNWMPIME